MKKNKWLIWCPLCWMLVVTGCVRNQFDLERYEEIVDEMSPVENVDENHNWQLSTTKALMVDINGLEDIERIQILTDNPAVTDLAAIVGEAYVSSKTVFSVSISYPNLQEKLYAAAIDSSRIKRLLQIRIGDGYRKHRLTRYITFTYDRSQISYCWVFRQDLNMLNILQPTNIHHQCLRRTQLPIVIFIHILNWRHLINNFVVALKIKLIANTPCNHQHPTEGTPYQPLIILHTFSLLK